MSTSKQTRLGASRAIAWRHFGRRLRPQVSRAICKEKSDPSAESQRVNPYASARLYARLGQRDLAFHWLERAYLARSHDIAFIKVHPELDNVRTDSRFQDLMHRVGFPQ
jgi:hypothetical protein